MLLFWLYNVLRNVKALRWFLTSQWQRLATDLYTALLSYARGWVWILPTWLERFWASVPMCFLEDQAHPSPIFIMGWGSHAPRNCFFQAWEYGNHYESLYISVGNGGWCGMNKETWAMGISKDREIGLWSDKSGHAAYISSPTSLCNGDQDCSTFTKLHSTCPSNA